MSIPKPNSPCISGELKPVLSNIKENGNSEITCPLNSILSINASLNLPSNISFEYFLFEFENKKLFELMEFNNSLISLDWLPIRIENKYGMV